MKQSLCKHLSILSFFVTSSAFSQSITKRVSLEGGLAYHTPLFSLMKNKDAYSNSMLLRPISRSDAAFERIEFRAGLNYRLKQHNLELSLKTYVGEGELYSDAFRVGNDIFRKSERCLFWTQGIHVNKYNKPQARHVFYYGAGLNVLNIGKQFDAKLKSSVSDPDPVDVTIQMQAVSFSAQMGRSIGKNGFSRNLMLELKAEYIPQWGQYLYTQEIKWLRFGTSLNYRFHLSEKQKNKQKL